MNPEGGGRGHDNPIAKRLRVWGKADGIVVTRAEGVKRYSGWGIAEVEDEVLELSGDGVIRDSPWGPDWCRLGWSCSGRRTITWGIGR